MEKKSESTVTRRHSCEGCGHKATSANREELPRGWVFELVPAPSHVDPPKLRPTCPLCQRSRFPASWGGE